MSRFKESFDYEHEYLDYEEATEDGLEEYEDEETRSYDDEDEEDDEEQDCSIVRTPVIDPKSLLCPTHSVSFKAECERCSAVKLLLDPSVLKDLGASSSSGSIPDVASWFGDGKPEKKPTLILPKAAIDYATAVYSAGPFQPRSKFDEVVRDHLYLSPQQNELLTKNLELEKMFRKYEKHPKFKYMMEMKTLLTKIARNGRIAHRPLFMAVVKLNDVIQATSNFGLKPYINLTYPDDAPYKALLGPREVQDHLSYVSADPFPLPDLTNVLDGTQEVSESDRQIIMNNVSVNMKVLAGFREKVKKAYMDLYDTSSDGYLHLKNLLNFHL